MHQDEKLVFLELSGNLVPGEPQLGDKNNPLLAMTIPFNNACFVAFKGVDFEVCVLRNMQPLDWDFQASKLELNSAGLWTSWS